MIKTRLLPWLLGVVCALSIAGAAEEPVVNVYNWSDYIAADTIDKFTKATGIKVNYDVYDSNETMFAKLQAGQSGYDLVFPSASPFLAQGIKAGIFRKLDRGLLTAWPGFDPAILQALSGSDPGNLYAAPYLVAATGIGYNLDKVRAALGADAKPDGWSLLFDPSLAAKLKTCGLSLLDAPTEVFAAALTYAGRPGGSLDKADIPTAAAVVAQVRPFVRYFHSSKYINDLANGDICVAHGYVGDLVQARARAREAGKGVAIVIYIPKEGAVLNIDCAAIPADAPHPGNAHRLIDFLMRPEIIAGITNAVGYANAVPASSPLVRPELLGDPAIYPPPAMTAREFELPPAPPDYERLRTRAWTRLKTGL
jgi:putrescine transport system substrate-binding protein